MFNTARLWLYYLKNNIVAHKPLSNTNFWSIHNVTYHKQYATREESLEHLDWRNRQYLFYEQLMPTHGFLNDCVLDFGCGPGHDLVGFAEHSNPWFLVGADISQTSLDEARERLKLHHCPHLKLVKLDENSTTLPFESNSFDYIQSSGVLHHIEKPETILREFHRILTSSGKIRVMVYNTNSIFFHLHIAYQMQTIAHVKPHLSTEKLFSKYADTGLSPFTRSYTPEEFITLCNSCGLKTTYIDSAISIFEMNLLSKRLQAVMDSNLGKQHRDFLREITFDNYNRPLYQGKVAGIDAVYELTKL